MPKRICIFVEPSPFTYVSGYKNRFTTMIKYLVEAGCDVLVVTTGELQGLHPPQQGRSPPDPPWHVMYIRAVSAAALTRACSSGAGVYRAHC